MNETAQQALAELAEATSLSPDDLRGLAQASEADLALLLATYRDAGVIASVSVFDRIVAGLEVVSRIAGIAIPMVGLAQSLRGLFTGTAA